MASEKAAVIIPLTRAGFGESGDHSELLNISFESGNAYDLP